MNLELLEQKYNCIFCKYRKLNKNHDYACMDSWEKDEYGYPIGECNSLSNIWYGKLTKYFPFNIIQYFIDKHEEKITKEYYDDYNEDFTENSSMKFIWGLKSYDDLSSCDANLETMNDIDLIYLKDEKKYILGVETAYIFNSKEAEKEYFKTLLDKFTEWMEEQGHNTNSTLNPYGDMYEIFSGGININTPFNTIEDAYRTFKLLVNGYLTL